MARVIKAEPGQEPAAAKKPSRRSRPVIEKEVYRAKKRAQKLAEEYRIKREMLMQEGARQAAQAREEAQGEGAKEAFAEGAQEALLAFRNRAERYGEAAEDIRVLALEVVQKVLGVPPSLEEGTLRRVLRSGLDKLRARRKLRVQVPKERLEALHKERPVLLQSLAREPDLVVEAASDVSPGYARVVTEAGGALCTEQSALDQLALSIDVDESAVAPTPQSVSVRVRELAQADVGFADEEKTENAPLRRRRKAPEAVAGDADPERTVALDVASWREEFDKKDGLYVEDSLSKKK